MEPVPMPADWTPFADALAWLERVLTLLDRTGGSTDRDALLIHDLTRALLLAAAGQRLMAVEPPTVVGPAVEAMEPTGAEGQRPPAGSAHADSVSEPSAAGETAAPQGPPQASPRRTRGPRRTPVPTAAQNGHIVELSDPGVFCTTPNKVYFSHTSPSWRGAPFRNY